MKTGFGLIFYASIVSISFSPINNCLLGQDISEKNIQFKSIHAYGTALGYYPFVSLNFEQSIRDREKSVWGYSVGIGMYQEGYGLPLHFFNIYPLKNNHHVELNYGLNLTYSDHFVPFPTLAIGYRYQDFIDKGFVFRVGVNLLFLPYLSLGYTF